MEEFFNVLMSRGVRIASSEQAQALGKAVADIAKALGMVDEGVITGSAETLVEETSAELARAAEPI
jgi:hypothetical protein